MQLNEVTKILGKRVVIDILFYIHNQEINYGAKLARKFGSNSTKYLPLLIESGLLEFIELNNKQFPYSKLDPRNKYFQLTKKGEQLINQLFQMEMLLK